MANDATSTASTIPNLQNAIKQKKMVTDDGEWRIITPRFGYIVEANT